MPSARYFRLISLEVYGYRFNLALSELRLYASGSPVDGSVTMSCVGTPTDGSLANLIDGNTATSCTFDGAEVALPGFYLQWDLGSTTAVDEMRITGVSQATWLHRFTLQSSDDAITWVDINTGVKTYWPGSAVAAVMSVPVVGLVDAELLLRGDGDDLSTSIIDSSGLPKTVTVHGNACISTSYSVFGGSSLHFDGAGDYLTVTSSYFDCGVSPFTIQGWVFYSGTNNQYPVIVTNSPGSWSPGAATLSIDHTWSVGKLGVTCYSHSSGSNTLTGATTLSLNTPYHFALVRDGTSLKLYLDGVLDGSANISSSLAFDWNYGSGLKIAGGNWDGGNSEFAGYIDDLCLSRKAEYTGDFTLPSAPIVISDATPIRPRLASLGIRFAGPSVADTQQSVNVQFASAIADNSNGPGTITGTVKEKAIPSNLPLSRKVRLMRERDGKCVRETWSDTTTGAYTFSGLDPAQTYTAIGYDHLHNYRAVAADNLAATR